MSRTERQLMEDLFKGATEIDAHERAAWLERACAGDDALRAEVESLLAADAGADDFLISPLASATPVASSLDLPPDTRIGQYRVVRVIGSGGMGTVYEAEQDQPRRRVALKLLRSGLTSDAALRRFANEPEFLARLHHPGIAQIYEAGTRSDGTFRLPYFAMEYIPGARSITDFATERGIGIHQRLELFVQACAAIEHGHQRGIIHRDLKPGNILVDASGRPKVIDFGVARSTDADLTISTLQTDVGQFVGTLRYMSPEQCEGVAIELDTRSDVYALGVVLFELLTGELPYDFSTASPLDAPRIIREQEPRHPSQLDRRLRGDIETIILKALEKDRRRRYASVAQLADDIRRHLANEPIEARRDSRWYVLRKHVSRHRTVAAVVIGLVGLLFGFSTTVTVMYRRAEAEASTAREVQRILERTLTQANPYEAATADRSLRDLLDETSRQLESDPIQNPRVHAAVRHTLGVAYTDLGRQDDAERQLLSALSIRREVLGPDHPDTAKTVSRRAWLRFRQGKQAEAEALCRQAIRVLRGAAGQAHESLLSSLQCLTNVLRERGRYDEAEITAIDALRQARTWYGESHPGTATALESLGQILAAKGRYPEAEARDRESLEILTRCYGRDHAAVARTLNNLALLLKDAGDYDAAEKYQQEALDIQQRVLGSEHPDVATSRDNLAVIMQLKGDLAGARPLFEQALDTRRAVLGESHPAVARSLINLGTCLEALGEYAEAENTLHHALAVVDDNEGERGVHAAEVMDELAGVLSFQGKLDAAETMLHEVLRIRRAAFGTEHPKTLVSLNDLAMVLQRKGKLADAEPMLREALQVARKLLGDEHPHVITYLSNLGGVLRELHRFDESEQFLQQACDLSRKVHGEQNINTANCLFGLGRLYLSDGRYQQAEDIFERLVEIRGGLLPASHPVYIADFYWLALAHIKQKEYAEASDALRENVRLMEVAFPEHWYLHANRSLLGGCLTELKQFEGAEPLVVEAYERLRQTLGAEHAQTQTALGRVIALYEATGQTDRVSAYQNLKTARAEEAPARE